MADIPAELRDAAQKYLETQAKKNLLDPSYNKREEAKVDFESAKEELLRRLCNWLLVQKP
ncbi:hypothetical protein [Hyalangium rubrum]|uniref:Uncharacterized protein n=1 Tax=Hyalangium rubrum TaxID=3103134 RepID=A0ABU5GZ07_9BACT|nr:hypothetical protein [Hyalangium sp. s54d21]MDY7225777.1 hypothetical protein [Hyalangium sp. s54d21]